MVRREMAGVPKIEVVGRSREKVEETFWDTITQVRATWRADRRNDFRYFARWVERNGHGGSTLPPSSVMMPVWIDAPWNGSATTS